MRPGKARAIRRKRDCLNPNPQWCNQHTHRHSVYWRCCQERPVQLSRAVASAWQAIASEAIQGDEEGAYVALDTFSTTGTRDRLRGASPKVTESSS
jgi:hypothetical protein